MHIRNARLMLLVLGSCIVILDSMSGEITGCIERSYPDTLSTTDISVDISDV